jgi:hypothetical protein
VFGFHRNGSHNHETRRVLVCLYGPAGEHLGTVRMNHLPDDHELDEMLKKFRAVHYDIKDRT